MREALKNLLFFVYKRFKILWILFILIIFFTFSYVNYYNNISQSIIVTSKKTYQLAQIIDKFINNIFEDINKTLLDQKPSITKENIISSLQHINMNHPRVSGIAIRDQNHQTIYSTLPHNKSFLLNESPMLIFRGPLKTPWFIHPIYVVQRKIGNYQAEIIIMSPVIKSILNSTGNDIDSITLYDENHQKTIIRMEQIPEGSWLKSKFFEILSPLFPEKISTSTQLNSIDGISLTVVKNKQHTLSNFWSHEILLILDILLLSTLLYFIIQNVLNKYYSLHGALKKAIKKEQFYPVYQPLYDAKKGIYVGAEVLLRWQYYPNKTIMPDLFIEEAEDTGLIIPITLQIVDIAFKETKEFFHTIPSFHLAFNLCAFHFNDNHFFDQLHKLVEQYSISPQQILLEITERYLLDVSNKIFIKRMLELRESGYSLAIDDYGTGHSSISYLQYYPFNYLKIDKIFIQAIGTKAITETLNDAIIHLAKKINLTIIAEGVETKEQVNYLLENDVYLLQGWYFSKALSIEELTVLLKGEKK